jgi:hypothetical protein
MQSSSIVFSMALLSPLAFAAQSTPLDVRDPVCAQGSCAENA